MTTIHNQIHPLLTVPFSAATEFTILAQYCENFAETLAESSDPSLRIALCGRLSACLMLLQPTLLDPVPSHLVESLTIETLPSRPSRFDIECTDLCHYCLALTQILSGQGLLPKIWNDLSCLLHELIHYFAAEIKAPRWIRTAKGVTFIDEAIETGREKDASRN